MSTEDRGHRSRAIWLFLLEQGGEWTATAIGEELGVRDPAAFLTPMVTQGLLQRRGGKPFTYSVDIDCKIARRITLRHLMKHGVAELFEEAQQP